MRDDGLPELVKASYVLEMLEHHFGGALATKSELADRMRDGKLRAYALETWHSHKRRPQDILRLAAPEDASLKQEISLVTLRDTPSWVDHAKNWDWQRGKFFAINPQTRPALR